MHAQEAQPLVSDDLLAKLTSPDHDAQRGEFDAETRALLAMALPEICSELLAYRREMRTIGLARVLASDKAAAAARLRRARYLLRQPDSLPLHRLADACRAVADLSPVTVERDAASEVLAQIERVA